MGLPRAGRDTDGGPGLNPVPATGPYMIADVDADGLLLVRNPAFREWSGAAQPDGFVNAISWRYGEELANAFDRLTAGELDWMTDLPLSEDLASLQTTHPDQVVLSPGPVTTFVGFDVRKPPFDDTSVRQALNYAIDRDHVVDLLGGPAYTRPPAASSTNSSGAPRPATNRACAWRASRLRSRTRRRSMRPIPQPRIARGSTSSTNSSRTPSGSPSRTSPSCTPFRPARRTCRSTLSGGSCSAASEFSDTRRSDRDPGAPSAK
jgi:hypothetical protein